MEPNQYPELTEKCRNFKNYLERRFQVREFGDFVCAYTFPLADINALVAEANQIGRAAAVRVYYGCNAGGDDHRLFLAVLDQNENVLAAQSAAHKRSADSDPTTKCPPGCRADAIIQSLL